MSAALALHATRCAICSTTENATEVYAANFSLDALNPAVFSARRLPDHIHYRLVKCNSCGLVRSDPVADPGLLEDLYKKSTFDYGHEIGNLQKTYGQYLARLARHGGERGSLLEVGCGNGFVLEEALRQGYARVAGVEPSAHAISRAAESVRPNIVCDIMRPGVFPSASFDAVALFQVFDHIPDPAGLLDTCFEVLRPGGLILCLNHNVEAVSARLLKDRSPIVDIEHTFLFSPSTMRRLFAVRGFDVKEVGTVYNWYSTRYLAQLLPIPRGVKEGAIEFLSDVPLGRVTWHVPLGNLFLIAQKPRAA